MTEKSRKYNVRKIMSAIAIIAFLCLIVKYAGRMTATVLDADTNQPIAGAAVLVEWTRSCSIGFSSTSSYKVVEAVTDEKGNFTVFPVLNPFADPPSLTVYKKGYVAWNNEHMFVERKKREDFEWKKGVSIKLEQFKENYSHEQHVFFIGTCLRSQAFDARTKMFHALDWELAMAREERSKTRR